MKRITLLIIALMMGILGFWSFSHDVAADTIMNSLTVSPPYQIIELVPGETYAGAIKVSSQAKSDVATKYEISVGPFSEHGREDDNDDYGVVDYIASSTYNQMVDWIELDKTVGTVEPNETQIVSFKIHVPEDAPAGGQYASIIVKDATAKESVGQGVAVQSVMQILSVIYANIMGETRTEGEILENTIPSFMLNGPLVTSSMVKNNGNVHTDAEYILQVWPLFSGEEICTNEEKPETSLILPETERYHMQTCNLPSVGIFRAKQTVRIFGETSIVERIVIICPLWLIFVIVIVLVALIFWIVFRVRSRKRANGSSKSDNE